MKKIGSAGKDKDRIVILVNPKIYPMEAIYGASYAFLDRAYIFLDGEADREIRVSIKSKKGVSLKELERLKDEFQNELLSYALREKISSANRNIREYIIGKALFNFTDECGRKDEELDYEKDDLGIAVPWEEKYGKEQQDKVQ